MGNPHQPFGNNAPIPNLGIYQFMEANLVIGDPDQPQLNATGVASMSSPFLVFAYSDRVGWTHTNDTIQNTNLYEITLTSNDHYLFGNGTRQLSRNQDSIKVLQTDGSLVSQSFDALQSEQGPIVAQNGNKALALRVAGLDQPSLVTQYWNMIRARNLKEFISNNPPWTSTFSQVPTLNPANFPQYIAPQFMDLRPQNAARFLTGSYGLTTQAVLAGKESVHMLLADRVLPDLIEAANASGDPTAKQAAAVLKAWDRNADASSRGAVLFERWWTIAGHDPAIAKDSSINFYFPHPQLRIPWSEGNPLNTPDGLADPSAVVADLIRAAQQVQTSYGALDVAWGVVHKTALVSRDSNFNVNGFLLRDPSSGADDVYGPVRVAWPVSATDGSNQLWTYGGDGYVQLVTFAPEGAQAQALLTYGNASRPGSPHITDQLKYYDAKTVRPVYRTRPDVEQHATSREVF